MKKNYWIYAVVLAVVAIPVYFFWPKDEVSGKHDDFAQCLTDRGVIMYGAYWCPQIRKLC